MLCIDMKPSDLESPSDSPNSSLHNFDEDSMDADEDELDTTMTAQELVAMPKLPLDELVPLECDKDEFLRRTGEETSRRDVSSPVRRRNATRPEVLVVGAGLGGAAPPGGDEDDTPGRKKVPAAKTPHWSAEEEQQNSPSTPAPPITRQRSNRDQNAPQVPGADIFPPPHQKIEDLPPPLEPEDALPEQDGRPVQEGTTPNGGLPEPRPKSSSGGLPEGRPKSPPGGKSANPLKPLHRHIPSLQEEFSSLDKKATAGLARTAEKLPSALREQNAAGNQDKLKKLPHTTGLNFLQTLSQKGADPTDDPWTVVVAEHFAKVHLSRASVQTLKNLFNDKLAFKDLFLTYEKSARESGEWEKMEEQRVVSGEDAGASKTNSGGASTSNSVLWKEVFQHLKKDRKEGRKEGRERNIKEERASTREDRKEGRERNQEQRASTREDRWKAVNEAQVGGAGTEGGAGPEGGAETPGGWCHRERTRVPWMR